MWPPFYNLSGGRLNKRPPFLIAPVLGGSGASSVYELSANGAFAADTNWTKATWTISAGVASIAGAATDTMYQIMSITPGANYSVTFTVTAFTAGTVTPRIGGTLGTARGSAATFTETIKAGGSDNLLAFVASAATLSIDNVSVTRL